MCMHIDVCAVSSQMKTRDHPKEVISLKLTASSYTDAAPRERLNKKNIPSIIVHHSSSSPTFEAVKLTESASRIWFQG